MSRVTKFRQEAWKRVPSDLGEWLVRTTDILRRHEVPTPDVRYGKDTQTLKMPWIGGVQGYDVLEDASKLDSFVANAAKAVARLHQVPVLSLRLEAFDPWKKVEPRLRNRASIPDVILDPAEKTAELLRTTFPGDPFRLTPVHGDFHIGQIVFGYDGTSWLLDLEDLAFGEPESDLANFAAHLATSRDNQKLDLLCRLRRWSILLSNEWSKMSHAEANCVRLEWYGAVALLRRAMKLSERHRSARDMTTAMRAVNAARSLAQRNKFKSKNR